MPAGAIFYAPRTFCSVRVLRDLLPCLPATAAIYIYIVLLSRNIREILIM